MNPYELRYQIYQSAKDILTEEYHCARQRYEDWSRANPSSNNNPYKYPPFPNAAEIELRAILINDFVNKK